MDRFETAKQQMVASQKMIDRVILMDDPLPVITYAVLKARDCLNRAAASLGADTTDDTTDDALTFVIDAEPAPQEVLDAIGAMEVS